MCWMWRSAVLGEITRRSAICAGREAFAREAEHVDLAAREAARVVGRRRVRGGGLAVPGGDEHGSGRAGLEHAVRLEPAELAGRVCVREGRAVGPLGGEPDVDLGRGEEAGAGSLVSARTRLW